MKNNKLLIITSALCLLPIVMSCAVYSDLPEQIAVHWDGAGSPDVFLPKAAAAFGLPVLFAMINIFSKIRLFNDPKRDNASNIMRVIIVWLIPFVSLAIMPVTLFIALGMSIPVSVIIPVFVGIIFVVFGNYLPKSRQNYSIGIKLPWTLYNADNWNKTHRAAGYLYITAGFFLIFLTFISIESRLWSAIALIIVILLILLPILYSYSLYRKSEGDQDT